MAVVEDRFRDFQRWPQLVGLKRLVIGVAAVRDPRAEEATAVMVNFSAVGTAQDQLVIRPRDDRRPKGFRPRDHDRKSFIVRVAGIEIGSAWVAVWCAGLSLSGGYLSVSCSCV